MTPTDYTTIKLTERELFLIALGLRQLPFAVCEDCGGPVEDILEMLPEIEALQDRIEAQLSEC